jgi:hypothetical protein
VSKDRSSGRARLGRDGSGKNGSVGDGSVGIGSAENRSVAKKVAADPPSFNWFVYLFFIGRNYPTLRKKEKLCVLGAKSTSIRDCVGRSVGRSVRWLVPMMQLRGKLVTSRLIREEEEENWLGRDSFAPRD